jgi:hypothetical protein
MVEPSTLHRHDHVQPYLKKPKTTHSARLFERHYKHEKKEWRPKFKFSRWKTTIINQTLYTAMQLNFHYYHQPIDSTLLLYQQLHRNTTIMIFFFDSFF